MILRRCRDNNPPGEQPSIYRNIIMISSVLDDGHRGKLKPIANSNVPDAVEKKTTTKKIEGKNVGRV